MKYSIDTSSLVEPWNRMYPPDIFPTLWATHLPAAIKDGVIRASEEVRTELERQDDDLLAWTKGTQELFVAVDADTQEAVSEILRLYPNLVSATTTRSAADPFVIALAQVTGSVVVTEERMRSPQNPRIPDVCGGLGVRCINLLTLIRDQGWRFT